MPLLLRYRDSRTKFEDDIEIEVTRETEQIVYEIGDHVVYPHHGAGPGRQEGGEDDPRRDARVPHDQDPSQRHDRHGPVVRTPARPVCAASSTRRPSRRSSPSSRDECSEMPKNWNRRFKHNRDKIKTGDIYELAEVVRNLAVREQEKGLSTGEKQMYTRAKKILASEMCTRSRRTRSRPRRTSTSCCTATTSPRRQVAASASHLMSAVALLVAAGRGERLGADRPKAFVVLAGRPDVRVVARRAARRRHRGHRGRGAARLRDAAGLGRGRRDALGVGPQRARRGAGGRATWWSSTTPRGRSCAPELFTRCVAALDEADAAIAAAPVTDTIKEARGRRRRSGRSTARGCGRSRRRRRSAATSLERALDVADDVLAAATDDASLVERAGGHVVVVESPPSNFKVTTPHDLDRRCCSRAVRVAWRCGRRRRADRLPRPPAPRRAGHRRPRSTSPRPTPSATARRPRSAGIAELGVSEHVHRFHAALDVWDHPFWCQSAADDLDEYVEFVREETDLRLGIEADFVPGREDRMAQPARPLRLGLRDRLGALPARPRGRHARAPSTSGAAASRPTRSGSATSRRSPRPRAPACTTSWPTPTWSRSGARGARSRRRDLRHYYEPAVEAFAEAGVAVEVSTAGLRKPVGEIYPARALPGDGRRGRLPDRAVLRRPRARAHRLRLRRRRSSCSRQSASTELASSRAASAGWSRIG